MARAREGCGAKVRAWVRRLRAFGEEGGQGLAEYALILTLVALVCVGALGGLGTAIAGSSGFTLP